MAVGFVQGKTANATGTSTTITPTSAVTAGDLLVATMRVGNGAAQTGLSVTDPSNTWTIIDTPSDNGGAGGDTMQTDYAANAASGSYVVTFHATSNGTNSFRAILEEFSGVATSTPLNDHGQVNTPASVGTSANLSATTAGTAAGVGDLVWYAAETGANTTLTPADNAGDAVPAAPSSRLATGWRAATAGGSQTGTIAETSGSGTSWAAGIATFTAATGGGTPFIAARQLPILQAVKRASFY